MSNTTEIHVDSEVPLVRITREFDHPVDKVFRAHTEPALVAQWMGPRSLTNEMVRWDCETGGGYVPGGIAEMVTNPLPRQRTRAGLHHLPGYYDFRNHIVDFLVTRATAH